MARDTRTGQVLEKMVLPSLDFGGYEIIEQSTIGERLGGGKHRVDLVVSKDGRRMLISLKWQQTSGTAEQKVPYEYMCLANTISENPEIESAYIVLGGNGWSKSSFFINGLSDWVNSEEDVRVLEMNDFISLANNGKI